MIELGCCGCESQRKKVIALKQELKTEREGNDFYGTPEIYLRGEHFFQAVITTDFGDIERTDLETNIVYQVAGKKARDIISKRKVIL